MMKLRINSRQTVDKFSNLEVGQEFSYNVFIYMKTDTVFNEDGEIYNCVLLSSGKHYYFNKNVEVVLVEAEVIVNY